ncbi:DUF3947 family protein [Bacillus cereus]
MMNHYFYSGRQVGAAITLAGAQGTIHAVNQVIQMQQQAQFAKMMQGQYMPYSRIHRFQCKLYIIMCIQLLSFPYHMGGLTSYKKKRLIRVAFLYSA